MLSLFSSHLSSGLPLSLVALGFSFSLVGSTLLLPWINLGGFARDCSSSRRRISSGSGSECELLDPDREAILSLLPLISSGDPTSSLMSRRLKLSPMVDLRFSDKVAGSISASAFLCAIAIRLSSWGIPVMRGNHRRLNRKWQSV